MKMTTSITFTIHAGCARVTTTQLQSVKRWQETCRSKRM